MKRLFPTAAMAAAAVLLFAAVSEAQVQGTIYKKDGGQATGNIRYLPASKMFEIQAGAVSVKLAEKDVARLNIAKPAQIDQAAAFMSKKQYNSAIPLLKQVLDKYAYLQWDEYALRGLGECYFNSGMESEGIKMIEKIMGDFGGESLSPGVVTQYWDALIKQKDYVKLERSIEKIIATGARSVAAVAQIKRGDMLKEKGKMQEAVIDGYLRTVVFFEEQKEAREEAVYKAMKTFQDMGNQTYADKMRKILNTDYPAGTWTKKAASGT